MNKPFTVTVSQLNRKIALMLEGEKTFANLRVKGEISNLNQNNKSGHIYFSLKDEASSISAVIYKSNVKDIGFIPEDGMSVIVTGSVRCYQNGGIYQISVTDITKQGVGLMAAELEQLKQKLEKEGLFSQKRQLPKFPEKICVITAETGAALQDILNILGRRFPLTKVVLLPVFVQGDKAPDSIVEAFQKSGKTGADLIIFGRGGGSSEDLSAFNDERVVRAVFNSSIPTISAVGHEIDFTLSDFAADLRAPTPSAAAEMAVPDIKELYSAVLGTAEFIRIRTAEIINKYKTDVELIQKKIQAESPMHRLKSDEQQLMAKFSEISDKYKALIASKEYRLAEKSSVISALNPLSVLMRGYSIVYKNNKVIFSADEVATGDEVNIRTSNGEFNAIVK